MKLEHNPPQSKSMKRPKMLDLFVTHPFFSRLPFPKAHESLQSQSMKPFPGNEKIISNEIIKHTETVINFHTK